MLNDETRKKIIKIWSRKKKTETARVNSVDHLETIKKRPSKKNQS
jgi:hypothetical protein